MIEQAQIQTQIAIFIILWIAVIIFTIRKNWREKMQRSGFSVIYIANLALIHLFVAFGYLLPFKWYGNEEWMLNGFRESTYAVLSFGFGNLILAPFVIRSLSPLRLRENNHSGENGTVEQESNLPKVYILVGAIAYFLLPSSIIDLPTVRAFVSTAGQLLVVGNCLLCWQAIKENNNRRLRNWLIVSLLFPFITIIKYGFLGYGTSMTIIVILFTVMFVRPRVKTLILAAIFIFFALSLYETYMRDRGRIRALVWNPKRKASLSERVTVLKDSFSNPVWFNPLEPVQLEVIDGRMNQNILVGAAVSFLGSGMGEYSNGKTIWDSVLALIPRALWPEKTVFAGSGDIVNQHTGLVFAEGTSVGVGQVMEFYINFGTTGIVIGFIIFGVIVAIIDIMAGRSLSAGNLRKFVFWFFPGICLTNVGGSLVELTSSSAAALGIAYLVSKVKTRYYIFLILLVIFLLLIRFLAE